MSDILRTESTLDPDRSPYRLDDEDLLDRVWELVNGSPPGFFEINGWRRRARFDEGAVSGPFILKVKLSDPIDGRDDDQIALIWDREKVQLVTSVKQGATHLIELSEAPGSILEVFVEGRSLLGGSYPSDAGYEISVHPIESRAELEAEAEAENKQKDPNALGQILDRASDSSNTIAFALVLGVAVIGGIYLIKS